MAGSAGEMVQGVMSTPSRRGNNMPSGYSGNLESAPDAYLQGDESSDEELSSQNKGVEKPKLDYDSDDKQDDEAAVPVSTEPESAASELIDLGAPAETTPSIPKKIPKLAGPGK